MTDDIALWPAHRQAAALAARSVSSRELLDAFLARIERLNPSVNAVVTLDAERGRADAQAADDARARGAARGPLHGLPITVKDALAVAGMRSTGGATELRDHVPTTDADVVANARAAGAFCFGKTNVPRWSGDLQTYNDVFGTTNNPWDVSVVPGGSSGGPATAVALGLTAFEIGTDIGGSIRVPAAYCGIAGHKPSYGIVPTGGYLDHLDGGLTEPDINVHGPLARSVDDLELLLDAFASPSPDRAKAWRVQLPPARSQSPAELRIALWSDDPACPASADTVAAIEAVGDLLARAGSRVDRTARPAIEANTASLLGLGLVGAAVTPSMDDATFAFFESLASDTNLGGVEAQLVGSYAARHRQWLAMDRERARIRAAWADFFAAHDVLLCPVIVRPPFPHLQEGTIADRIIDVDGHDRPYRDLLWWTILIGMAHLPATVVPIGRTADGLPIGIQVVGPYLEDRTCLAAARMIDGLVEPIGPPPLALS